MSKDKIRDVLTQYGEDYNDQNVWKVQGTPVISHKTLERIAAKAGIQYKSPTIIRAERDEAVILVEGYMTGNGGVPREEWSIGEALVNVNYRVSGKQAGYVWAMAEKRAKDRVILKLVSLHGLAYSEEEADEFKGRGNDTREPPATAFDHPEEDEGPSWSQLAAESMIEALSKRSGPAAIETFLAKEAIKRDLALMDMDDHTRVMRVAAQQKAIVPVTSGVAA